MKISSLRRTVGLVATAAAAGVLVLLSLTTGAQAAPAPSDELQYCSAHGNAAKVGHFGGVLHAVSHTPCSGPGLSDAATGSPPLIFHGGPVMGTPTTGPVVVTSIFWNPAGHAVSSDYKSIIGQYLSDVAAASGQHTNVFSTLNEYYGSNGSIRYKVANGGAIEDTNPLPTSGCEVTGADANRIYADRTGYDACLDDDQVQAEVDAVVSARHLPRDYGHIYVMFLPKHVESCFYAGSTKTAANFCTINHEPSTAYCAYHFQTGQGTVYANMPWPVYGSATNYTCSAEFDLGATQAPNGNLDADTEISPTSHEIMEAITDPDTVTGWFDNIGYENGDECAYVYGQTQGTPGALYNQVIKRHHYLTQEEFSNVDFAKTGGGCLPYE